MSFKERSDFIFHDLGDTIDAPSEQLRYSKIEQRFCAGNNLATVSTFKCETVCGLDGNSDLDVHFFCFDM